MQAELNVVWDKLLPAFHNAPLTPNADEEPKLKQMLSNLSMHGGHTANVIKQPGT